MDKITMQLKTRFKYTSVCVAAALSMTAIPVVNATSASIINAGFENNFSGWADTEPSSISGNANTGEQSAKISADGGAFEQDITVDAYTNYELTVYIKGTGEIGVIVDGTIYTNTGGGGDEFEKVTVSFNSSHASTVTIFGRYYGAEARFDDFSVDTTAYDSSVPYDYSQYQDALDNANLQQTDLDDCSHNDINASCSKSDVVKAGGYEGYSTEYFYIDKQSGWLTFEMEGDSNRTELRFAENFKTNSETTYTLTTEVLPINPLLSVSASGDGKEITLLQVHNKGENAATDETVLSHPLLRIIWDGESRTDDKTGLSYSESYWAVIKTNAYECSKSSNPAYLKDCPDSYGFYYLADYDADNATKFEIITGNEQLIINVDDSEVINYDISYWSHLYSYFKAGVYNQYVDGNSIVQFKTMTYEVNDGSEKETDLPMFDLDPALSPSENFDLSLWYLSVPTDVDASGTADSISEKNLNLGYADDKYFYTAEDGGMVFNCPIDGYKTSVNTSYTRSELREMLRDGDTSVSTKGVNANNWVFGSVPDELQDIAGGIDGNMVATLAVNHVTTTGYKSYAGRVIIGQIHAASDEPVRLYYRLLPGHTKGSIYFAHEPSNGNDEQWYEMIGARSSGADEPADGIELNEKFSYEIDIAGDIMTVSIMRDGKDTITQEVDMSESGYSDGYYDADGDGIDETPDYMYFKAGVYNQNKLIDEDEDGIDDNGADGDDYVQATFYYLTNTH